MSILSDRLSELRKQSGYSQLAVAEKLGIKRTTLAHYESGKREPPFNTLLLFATFYNVTTDYLLGRSDTYVPPLTPGQQLLFQATVGASEEEIINTIKILEALRG